MFWLTIHLASVNEVATCHLQLQWYWDACRFEEDVALQQRMSAIGDIIQEQGYPHFICFQVQLFET